LAVAVHCGGVREQSYGQHPWTSVALVADLPDERRSAMPTCENTIWQTNELGSCIAELREATGGPDEMAEEVAEIASRPGPLHTCLALSSCHVAHEGETRPALLGRLMSCLASQALRPSAAAVVDRLTPLFRWSHGVAGISVGTELLGSDCTTRLLSHGPELAERTIRAIWLVGLLDLAGISDDRDRAVRALQASLPDSPTSAIGGTIQMALSAFARIEADILGPRGAGPWHPVNHDLWCNALAMARRQGAAGPPPETAAVLPRLLQHVRSGGRWPLPCQANEAFRCRAVELDRDCEGFWHCSPVVVFRCTRFGRLRLHFLDDPLKVLDVGNAFDTCLRLGGLSEGAALGWAANANVRIIGVRGEDGRLLGRRTVGLSLQDATGLSPYQSYPRGEKTIAQVTDRFLECWTSRTHLDRYDGASVEDTCAPAYWDPPVAT